MNSQWNEEPRIFVVQTDDEKKEAIRTASADATAHRLKTKFSEGQKRDAAHDPEAGCVAWYHFPLADQ